MSRIIMAQGTVMVRGDGLLAIVATHKDRAFQSCDRLILT